MDVRMNLVNGEPEFASSSYFMVAGTLNLLLLSRAI